MLFRCVRNRVSKSGGWRPTCSMGKGCVGTEYRGAAVRCCIVLLAALHQWIKVILIAMKDVEVMHETIKREEAACSVAHTVAVGS